MTDDDKYLSDCQRAGQSLQRLCESMVKNHGMNERAVAEALLALAISVEQNMTGAAATKETLERIAAELTDDDPATVQ